MNNNLKYWLALHRAPGVGTSTFYTLLQQVKDPKILFENKELFNTIPKLRAPLKEYLLAPNWDDVEKDLRWAEAEENHILTYHCSQYPPLLRETDSAPPLLFAKGNTELLKMPQLAMVGSRNPSSGGKENAFNFAKSLAQSGMTITSGMALGIDAASHQGALSVNGFTIAVAGTGADRIYPAKHQALAHQIVDNNGLIISEFVTGTPPIRANFPLRNRIISGLSLGVLVVEAATKSGSLITARMAGEQGREIFAMPGSIHNPLAKGCHALIKQGAKLVEITEDILEELGQIASVAISSSKEREHPDILTEQLDNEYTEVLENLGFEPTAINNVVERSGLAAEDVASMLLVLELQGYVESHSGGHYSRTK